jgi:outer membrane protein assembly factor BamA
MAPRFILLLLAELLLGTLGFSAPGQQKSATRCDPDNEIHFGDTVQPPLSSIDNLTPFTDQQLRALFLIQDGEIFDIDKLRLGIGQLQQAYGNRGFVNFTTIPSLAIDENLNRIAVFFEFDKGKQFRYGKVEVTGMNPWTAKNRLRNAGLIPGHVFSFSHLEEFKKQNASLLPTAFNTEADVERRIDEKAGTVNLLIHVGGCDAP